MANERKLSMLDPNQISRRLFDEEQDAQRVFIVNEQDSKSVGNSSCCGKKLQVIEIPTIVKEVQLVEVPVIVKEKEVIYVNGDNSQQPLAFEKIEVPVIITKTEYKDLPIWLRVVLIAQSLTSIIMLLKMLK